MTSVAHGVNEGKEKIKNEFPLVYYLTDFPSKPVVMRWHVWLDVVVYYTKNFSTINKVILDFTKSQMQEKNGSF